MRNRKEHGNGLVTILLGTITILSLTVCLIFICLYLKTMKDLQETVETAFVQENTMETIDFGDTVDAEETMGGNVNEETTEEVVDALADTSAMASEPQTNQGNSEGLFPTFDNEDFFAGLDQNTLQSVKSKMQEMASNKDIGLVTTLRYFFPDKLIFYDKTGYIFADILQDVRKHNYRASNFVMDESGEISYVEEGNVISHKGIDVSKYQGTIDWNAVASDGVEYAFIRLGIRGYQSGAIVLDDTFPDNMMNAQNAGVKTGVYFFTQAISTEEAIEEAQFVIANLEGYDVECPVVFDVEMITDGDGRANNLTQQERTDICIAFCDKIREAGYTPMIYGNIKCFVNMIDLRQLENYEKWFAFYDTYLYCPYDISMWQYTESGSVAGIEGKVDLNVCFKEW